MTGFSKRLTLADQVLIGAGGAIGSGILRSPSQVAAALPSTACDLVAWGLGGLLTLAGALTFAELGAAMPRAGGQYVWLSEAYGSHVGFLHGWAYFLVVGHGRHRSAGHRLRRVRGLPRADGRDWNAPPGGRSARGARDRQHRVVAGAALLGVGVLVHRAWRCAR